ncbi:MAG: DUF3179 domain-containing protein [Anaerolineae bacterium]
MRKYMTGFGILILVVTTIVGSAASQNSCDHPFEGVAIQFSNGFWQKTDFCQHSIDYADVLSGGPPPNGIPPIGFPAQEHLGMPALPDPKFESIEGASSWLQPQSPVIALNLNDEARAYPLAILIWHEIVNDVIGDTPIAVTFCPLCNSSIVFERQVNGETLYFGTTGNLRNSDLIMWDDKSQSWWQQFTGEGIVGHYTGMMLTMLPSQVVGFAQFSQQYPDGQVLSRETGTSRSYGVNPYTAYDSSEQPFLYRGELDTRLPATARVLAAVIGGMPIAYPLETLQSKIAINDTVGGEDVVALWQGGVASALDSGQIDDGRDTGTAALYSRNLDGQVLTLTAGADGVIHDEQTGSTWNAFGTAIEGELQGRQLQQMLGALHFWFAWAAFQPDTGIYSEQSE